MTPKEAIETIKMAIAEVEWNYHINYAAAFETAIEALEKQTPKKPVITTHHYRQEGTEELGVYRLSHCPSCWENESIGYFRSLIDKGTAFCRHCGQALDWSDNDKNE